MKCKHQLGVSATLGKFGGKKKHFLVATKQVLFGPPKIWVLSYLLWHIRKRSDSWCNKPAESWPKSWSLAHPWERRFLACVPAADWKPSEKMSSKSDLKPENDLWQSTVKLVNRQNLDIPRYSQQPSSAVSRFSVVKRLVTNDFGTLRFLQSWYQSGVRPFILLAPCKYAKAECKPGKFMFIRPNSRKQRILRFRLSALKAPRNYMK